MAGKKKKNPEGQNITRHLPFQLTAEEISERAKVAAKENQELDEVVRDKKEAMDVFNSKIKTKTAKIHDLLTQIDSGIENREVECVEHKNFEQNVVEYWFEGQKMDSREMTINDRQMDIDDVPKPTRKRAKTVTRKKVAVAPEKEVESDPGFSGVYEDSEGAETQPSA